MVDQDLFARRAEKCPRLRQSKEKEENLVEIPSGKEGTQRTRGSDDERHEVQINTLTESIGKTPETGGPNKGVMGDGDKKDDGGREINGRKLGSRANAASR